VDIFGESELINKQILAFLRMIQDGFIIRFLDQIRRYCTGLGVIIKLLEFLKSAFVLRFEFLIERFTAFSFKDMFTVNLF